MKRRFWIIILVLFTFINISKVAAECTVTSNAGAGNTSKKSSTTAKCSGAICGRTVIFKNGKFVASGGTSAIYGIRVTIQEKVSGSYKDKESVNVWATKDMKNWVNKKIAERFNNEKIGRNIFVSGINLASYGSSNNDPGIKRLDDSSATYKGYIKYLSNTKILNKVLKNMKNDDFKTVQKLVDNDNTIRVKVEPIYVLYILGSSVNYPGFVIGTAQGVANITRPGHTTGGNEDNAAVVAQNKSNNDHISQDYYGGKIRDIYNSMGNGYNVVTNFLKSVYVNPNSKPTTYGGWHEKAANGNAGVGYIYLDVKCKTTGKITVANFQTRNASNPKSGAVTFKGCASFELQKKKTNSSSYVKVESVNLGKKCTSKTSHNQQVSFNNLGKGTYRIVLKKIPKNAPEGKVTKTSYYYKKVKYSSTVASNIVIKSGQTVHTVNFYNYIPKSTTKTTTTSTKAYHIQVYKNQTVGNFSTISATATASSGVSFKPVYNSPNKDSMSGCKKTASDTTAGLIQCYQLLYNNSDKYNNNLAAMYTDGRLEKYDGPVTFTLEKLVSGSWKESRKTVVDSDDMPNAFTPAVEWTVKTAGTYRVIEKKCNNCGGSKTYSKTQSYQKSNGQNVFTYFRQGKASKAFYIGTTTSAPNGTGQTASKIDGNPGKGTYYRVWFINHSSTCNNCCPNLLNTIKSETDSAKIKNKLVSLYNQQLSEFSYNYNKLLNFTPTDTATTIQAKINNGTIKCENTQYSEGQKNLACNYNDFGLSDMTSNKKIPMYVSTDTGTSNYLKKNKFTSSNYINLSSYASNSAKRAAEFLLGIDTETNDVYCYVDYAIDLETDNIIKNDVNLTTGKSFIWKAQPINKVGNLFSYIHCEGNVEDEDTIKLDNANISGTILDIFKDRKLKIIDSSNKTLQTLTFSTDDSKSFMYKSFEPSEMECSSLGSEFQVNPENGLCEPKDVVENEEEATEHDTCLENEELINGVCVSSEEESVEFDQDEEGDELDVDTEELDESDSAVEESGITYSSSYLNLDFLMNYPILYSDSYFADLTTGTVNKSEGKNLNWGVPIPIDSYSGELQVHYEFDEDNELYQTLKDMHKLQNNKNGTCSYVRTKCENCTRLDDIKVRFINTNNPFIGQDGNGRMMGSNWNSCLVAKQTIGVYSDISAFELDSQNLISDLDGSSSTDKYVKLAGKARYCKYGDLNCDSAINNNDIMIFDTKKSILNTGYAKIIADVNQDKVVDDNDKIMIQKFISNDNSWWTNTSPNGCMNLLQNTLSNNFIVNNGSNSNSQKTPMYSFTLSPDDIQKIRNYNTSKTIDESNSSVIENSYLSTDNLVCSGNYDTCVSNFITSLLLNNNDNNINLQISSYGGYCLTDKYINSSKVSAGVFVETKVDRNYCLRNP